jgi:thioredoxin-dependent peroxiredoxin
MDAYRDQYATLFNGGEGVTLLTISTDPDTALASWARDKDYAWTFLSDPEAKVGTLYGAAIPERKLDNRTLFIIGRDGRIAHVMAPFREVDARAYRDLKEALDRVRAGP